MSPTRPNAPARRRLRGGPVLCVLALLLLAAPSWAARVTEVRVGRHPEFTRVVFELDTLAGYRVERVGGSSRPELRVTLDAAARPESIPFRTKGISKVVVDADSRSAVAHIALREKDIPVKEMILTNPPRIVLDVMRSNVVVVRKPAPQPTTQTAAAQPAEAEKAAAEKAKAEKLAAEKAEAERLAAQKAAAEKAKAEQLAAQKTAREKAEAERLAAEKAEAERLAAQKAAAEQAKAEQLAAQKAAREKAEAERLAAEKSAAEKAKAEQLAAQKTGREKAESEAQAALEAESAERLAAQKAIADALAKKRAEDAGASDPENPMPGNLAQRDPDAAPRPGSKTVKPKPADAPTSKPSTTTARTTTDDSLDVGGLLPDALSNPMVLGAGGVLLCLVGFLLMRRRRRPLPNDLDVMAIAEGRDGPDTLMGQLEKTSDPLSQGGRGGSALDGLFDDEPQPDSPRTARQAPTRASAPPTGGGADESLFDTEADPNAATMMGDPKMNQGMSDLPADPDRMPSSSAAGGSSAPDSDVLRVVHELERRMAQLEGKLQEANEARERLERQVAAQSEELRVQRAAIARTQRALRTMSRGDEDKATEPALRDGDTQTRTRVATE